MSRDHALLAALNALCREAQADTEARADLPAFLARFSLPPKDVAELEGVGARRLLVYRALVHNRIRHAIRDFMPRALARRGKPAFDTDFRAYMQGAGPRSYYLRDVPGEFLKFVTPRWSEDPAAPEYLPQLARHEVLDYELVNHPGGGEEPTGLPLALDAALLFDSTATLVDYGYALHELSLDPADRTDPRAEPTSLLAYRDPKQLRPRYLSLTPFGREVLGRLLGGEAVTPALRGACAAIGEPLDDTKLGIAAALFADLGERGVILGAVAPPTPQA